MAAGLAEEDGFIAVIAARNEATTVSNTLIQLGRAGVKHAILVCNGCLDNTLNEALLASPSLPFPLRILWFNNPLGHDVARAIGSYIAKRTFPETMRIVFIDADWGGSFGPMLESFLQFGGNSQSDVISVTWRSLGPDASTDPFYATWREVLTKQRIVPQSAVPFVMPMAVRLSVFDKLSPMWLANPGWWFASVVQTAYTWSVYEEWDIALIGHRNRSMIHNQAMKKRIALDGHIARLWCNRTVKAAPITFTPAELAALPSRDLDSLYRFASMTWRSD